jgi:hypothetical protein
MDSSLAIEYLNAEGVEHADDLFATKPPSEDDKYLMRLLRSDRNYLLASQVRSRIVKRQSRMAFVLSPLVWIEVNGWIARERLLGKASQVTKFTRLQKQGAKRIGELLTTIRQSSDKSSSADYRLEAERLFASTTVSSSGLADGLRGVAMADIRGFEVSKADVQVAVNLAYMQVGLGDILHLLVARHVGCDWFATLDGDFKRAKETISTSLGMTVLVGSEILKAM